MPAFCCSMLSENIIHLNRKSTVTKLKPSITTLKNTQIADNKVIQPVKMTNKKEEF